MNRHIHSAAMLAVSICGCWGAAASGQVIHDNFDDVPNVDANNSVCSINLGSRFLAHNIWGIGATIGTTFCVVKGTGVDGDPQVPAPSGAKYFVHYPLSVTGDVAIVFVFTNPVSDFRFIRPQLDGTSTNNVVFPSWTLDALDSSNNILDTVSESSITATSTVPSQVYSVTGCAIDRVMITSNGGGTATTPGMIIDDIVMVIQGCGSADFDGDGSAGTDWDIEAFFDCLSGDCCLLCGSADFDGDCDPGTEADIEAFFSVLGGHGC